MKHPTLQDQQRAGLVTAFGVFGVYKRMRDLGWIGVSIAPGKPARMYPRGVYVAKGAGGARHLVSAFQRVVDGRKVHIRVGKGESGDFSEETITRLADAYTVAVARWDAERALEQKSGPSS